MIVVFFEHMGQFVELLSNAWASRLRMMALLLIFGRRLLNDPLMILLLLLLLLLLLALRLCHLGATRAHAKIDNLNGFVVDEDVDIEHRIIELKELICHQVQVNLCGC